MNKRFLPSVVSIVKRVGRPKYDKAISKILAIGLLIIVCVVIAVGAYYAFYALPKEPTLTPTLKPTTTPTETPEPLKSDLEVASVSIVPSQPKAGQYFFANIYVTNNGEVASGSYDVAIYIKDISRGSTYPLGTYRQEPMQPGEQYVVWSSDKVMVNFDGAHQLWVEIVPFNFEDGDDSNNVYGWAFTVTP